MGERAIGKDVRWTETRIATWLELWLRTTPAILFTGLKASVCSDRFSQPRKNTVAKSFGTRRPEGLDTTIASLHEAITITNADRNRVYKGRVRWLTLGTHEELLALKIIIYGLVLCLTPVATPTSESGRIKPQRRSPGSHTEAETTGSEDGNSPLWSMPLIALSLAGRILSARRINSRGTRRSAGIRRRQ